MSDTAYGQGEKKHPPEPYLGESLMRSHGLYTQADALTLRARRLMSAHRTRARRDGVSLDYSAGDIRALLAASACCTYCGLPVAFDAQLDHRTPTSRGGRHALDNLAVACQRCNQLKGMLAEAEYRELLTLLALLHPAARQDLERRLIAGGKRYASGRRGHCG
jgi:5-methylcytosine-specific restriction endonuclease McrA